MNFKTPLCSHIDRFMVIVSKMTDGKYISLCYKISVFYFERVFHSFLMSQAPERYIIEYHHCNHNNRGLCQRLLDTDSLHCDIKMSTGRVFSHSCFMAEFIRF